MELSSTVLSAAAESVRRSERAARAQTAVRHEDTRPDGASKTGDDLEKRTHHLETGSVLASLESDLQKRGIDISSLPLQRGRRAACRHIRSHRPRVTCCKSCWMCHSLLWRLHTRSSRLRENDPDSNVTALCGELPIAYESSATTSYWENCSSLSRQLLTGICNSILRFFEHVQDAASCGKYPSMLQAARDECWQLLSTSWIRWPDLQRCQHVAERSLFEL